MGDYGRRCPAYEAGSYRCQVALDEVANKKADCPNYRPASKLGITHTFFGEGSMTQPRHHWLINVASCLLLFVPALSAQALQIINGEGHSTTLTAEQIANSPHVLVKVRDHDTAARFEGVPLSALLTAAGIPMGDTLPGPRMTEVLLVGAADGYKVVFALAEVDPAFSSREIILAVKRDGKPLEAKEGPFRIVAPGDTKPARWIRQVTELRLISVK
jgi:hypothetical protein